MLSEYSRLLDCRRINLRIFLAFRILHQAFCAKSFGDSVRRIAGISKFVQYCTALCGPRPLKRTYEFCGFPLLLVSIRQHFTALF